MKNIDNIIEEEIGLFIKSNILNEWGRPAKGRKKARQTNTRYGGNLANRTYNDAQSQKRMNFNQNSQEQQPTPSQVNNSQEDGNNPYVFTWSGEEVGNAAPQIQEFEPNNTVEQPQGTVEFEEPTQFQEDVPQDSQEGSEEPQETENNEQTQEEPINDEQEQQNSHINSRGINLDDFVKLDENNPLSNALYRLMKQKYLKNTTVTFSMIRQLRQIGW